MWTTLLNRPDFIHRCIGLLGLLAWVSLAIELEVLLGPDGLYPIDETMGLVDGTRLFSEFPTHFWWDPSAKTLWIGLLVGCAGCGMALANRFSQVGLLISGAFYLSYCTVGRDFFSFQWDSLMVELCLIGCLIPTKEHSLRSKWLPRLLLFKIMFLSGIAKWQSHLGDWHDGSAMQHYYETAPIPTWLGWYAHHLPNWWHTFESWWALFFELVVPFLLFGPRRMRQIAAGIFGLFFIVDVATANYGFFVPQAALLSIICCAEDWPVLQRSKLSRIQDGLAVGLFALISTCIGLNRFAETTLLTTLTDPAQQFHLINAYHLFGHITQKRIEPVISVLQDGEWVELDFIAKPGNPMRPPTFMTPLQPRVDFRLWFYGLGYHRGTPPYVERLLERICKDSDVIQDLFVTDITEPEAIELRFYDYQYCSPKEKSDTGCWWSRSLINQSDALDCAIFNGSQ